MTIKGMEFVYFEGHAHTILNFSDGVNIITGLSGHGKSSIVRVMDWILENKPAGDAMISHFADQPTSGCMEFSDDSYILRTRGKKVNSYEISSVEGAFNALRGKVPEQVKTLANMDEGNIQKQKDFYFLLNDSAGQVARTLNKVSGLEEMDDTQAWINSEYRESNTKLKALFVREGEVTAQIEDLRWIKDADRDYEEIERMQMEEIDLTNQIDPLSNLISNVEFIKRDIDSAPDLSAIPRIDSIFEIEGALIQIEEEIETLLKLTETASKLDKELKGTRLPSGSEIAQIEHKADEIRGIEFEITKLWNLILHIASLKVDIKNGEQAIAKLKHKHSEILVECGECPVCGRRI